MTVSSHRLVRTPVVFLLSACMTLCCGFSDAVAQLDGRITEKPIGTAYVRNVNQARMLTYFQALSKRLEIGKDSIQGVELDEVKKYQSAEIQEPLTGAAYYLVQGVLPSLATVYFQQIGSTQDAKKIIDSLNNQFGRPTELIEHSETCFLSTSKWSSRSELPEGVDEELFTRGNVNSGGTSQTVKIEVEDGKKYVNMEGTRKQYYRVHDSLLCSAEFEDLWTMTLPPSSELLGGTDGATDMGLQANFDRIPQGMKQLGWNMLSSGVGTQLQQRDGEDSATYDLRRLSGDLGLNAARAILFDIDSTDGTLRLSSSQKASLNGELIFNARRNSKLTKQLQDLTSGRSRFAPMLQDNAAATVHVCVQLPEDAGPMIQAAGSWVEKTLAAAIPGNSSANMAKAIADSLRAIAEHRTVEMLVKIGWTKESDGVIYGGIQVGDQPRLIPELHALLSNFPNTAQEILNSVSLTQDNGNPLIVITLPGGNSASAPGDTKAVTPSGPNDMRSQLTAATGLKLTHIFLTMQDSCLWFAAGTDRAIEIIHQSTSRGRSSGTAAHTPLVSATLDLDRWLAYPQDDPAGIAFWPLWLDANSPQFPPPLGAMFGGMIESDAPVPLLQRVLDLGGNRDASLVLDADQSGVILRAELGEAIGNYYLARIISFQDNMIRRNAEAAEAEQKKTQGNSVTPKATTTTEGK